MWTFDDSENPPVTTKPSQEPIEAYAMIERATDTSNPEELLGGIHSEERAGGRLATRIQDNYDINATMGPKTGNLETEPGQLRSRIINNLMDTRGEPEKPKTGEYNYDIRKLKLLRKKLKEEQR